LIIRVQAFASLAILLIDRATDAFATTVTSVPTASAIVVLVVAIFVALVIGQGAALRLTRTALGFLLGAILAFALFAIFDVGLGSAAVTTVPSTTTRIVVVVAVAVAFEFRSAACFLEIFDAFVALRFIRAVPALAVFAVSKIFGAAAITPIPSTPCVVVVVIAVAVTLPIWSPATFFDRFSALITLRHVCAVTALAIFAKFVVVFDTTAVTLVPVATCIVVGVVAELVADVIFCATGFLRCFDTFVALGNFGTVQAFALFTELILILGTTAIAAIPITASVVVFIVTVLVTLPFGISALALDFLNTRVGLVFKFTVHAFTTIFFITILVVIGRTTTIPTIPVTSANIVGVVAVFIALVFWFRAFA